MTPAADAQFLPGPPRLTNPQRGSGVDAWLAAHGFWVDVAAAAIFLVMLGLPSLAMGGFTTSIGSAALIVSSLGMPIAFAFRRRNPVASAVAIHALALLHFATGVPLIFADLLIYASVYSVTVHGPLWARRVSLASAVLGSGLMAIHFGFQWSGRIESLLSISIFFVAASTPAVLAWAVALLRRSFSQRTESLRERAERLERERDQQATIAAAAERARIAREMHDVVAHSLSIVIAQADGGRYAAATSPDAAVTALTTIGDTGRSALADMRRILGVLRSEGPRDERTPQPQTQDIASLVETVRSSGLPVSLTVLGTPQVLPAGLGLAVYRVCQESLTNIMKHAGPAPQVNVRLVWRPSDLLLEVHDNGRGAAAGNDGAGHGVMGMRERAELFGGSLEAAPVPDGFRVRARFPYPPSTGSTS